jgi:acetyl-CoA/propionyl-CoA carboxylase, biotin carboxylase, biotin carboxyl carrier protein
VRGLASRAAEIAVGDRDPVPARAELMDRTLLVSYGGRTLRFACAKDGDVTWVGRDGHAWALTETTAAPTRAQTDTGTDSTVRSPMPGTVIAVHVNTGQPVATGQPLLVVEAMKMEYMVTAPLDGTVADVTVKPGQRVGMDETLVVLDRQELTANA